MSSSIRGTGDERQRSAPRSRDCFTKGYTLIEFLAVTFIIAVVAMTYQAVRRAHGFWAGVAAALLAGGTAFVLVAAFYAWLAHRDKQRLRDLREKYHKIYRVNSLPTDEKSIVKREGAEIRIGDYGWEAAPNRNDGLIHLQGLTRTWHVVWHAGFRPAQLEEVARKPSSQYDYWVPCWVRRPPPPPCPFPVQERKTPTMGLPHLSGRYFEAYPAQET